MITAPKPNQTTQKLYILFYENGLMNFAGVDGLGKPTANITHSPHSVHIAKVFGQDWRDKITKVQTLPDEKVVCLNDFKAKVLSITPADYQAMNRRKFSQLIKDLAIAEFH